MKTIRIGVWMVCVMLAGAVWAAQPPNPNAEGKKPVGEAPPRSLRTYHFGCSTTDCVTYWADPSGIAKSLGKTHEWSRFTIPGCGVECVWAKGASGKVGELGASSWDGVVVACYPNGNPLTIENDLKFMGYLYEAALKKNPNCILYVSSVWPFNADGLKFEQQWNSTTTQYHAGYASRKFHEDLIKAAQAKYGAAKARLLPFGHAMAKMNDWIKSGKTTRLNNVFQLLKDYIHLTDEGSYLLAMVQYAVLFKSDPHGATRTFQAGDHAVTVDEAFAKLAWDVAWETVNELSEFTGVGKTGVAPTTAREASRNPSRHPKGGERILFVGNNMTGYVPPGVPGGLDVAVRSVLASGSINVTAESYTLPWPAELTYIYKEGLATEKIKNGHYDIVVLQSWLEPENVPAGATDSLLKTVKLFNEVITASGGKTMLFMTYPNVFQSFRPDVNMYVAIMTKTANAYESAAELIGRAPIAPVGLVFQDFIKSPPPGKDAWLLYEPNVWNAGRPEPHGQVPSQYGQLLSAYVFYKSLTGKSPVGLKQTYYPAADPKIDRMLQERAELITNQWMIDHKTITGMLR